MNGSTSTELKQEDSAETTVKTEMGDRPTQIVIRKNIPLLKGTTDKKLTDSTLISDWLYILESYFTDEKITDDVSKINHAKLYIDYNAGEARQIIKSCYATTWKDFKHFMTQWLGGKKLHTHNDLCDFCQLTWDKNAMNFANFCRHLEEGINRIKINGETDAKKLELLYQIAQSKVINSLPEKTRKKYADKKHTAIDGKTFSEFKTEVNEALQEDPVYTNKPKIEINAMTDHRQHVSRFNQQRQIPVHITRRGYAPNRDRSGFRHRSLSNMRQTDNIPYIARKNGLCARCLQPGHNRFTNGVLCDQVPKCPICKDSSHEFLDCKLRTASRGQSHQRNQQGSTRTGSTNEGKNQSSFLEKNW